MREKGRFYISKPYKTVLLQVNMVHQISSWSDFRNKVVNRDFGREILTGLLLALFIFNISWIWKVSESLHHIYNYSTYKNISQYRKKLNLVAASLSFCCLFQHLCFSWRSFLMSMYKHLKNQVHKLTTN